MLRVESILLVALLSPAVSEAATLTVCAAGCDGSEVADVVAIASSGDRIEISAGTYTAQVAIADTNLDLIAVDGAGTAILRAPGTMLQITGASNVAIDGLDFGPGGACVSVIDGANTTVQNSTLDQCVDGTVSGSAIRAAGSASVTLLDSVVRYGQGLRGVVSQDGDASFEVQRVRFEGNQSQDGAFAAIGTGDLTLTDVDFVANTSTSSGGGMSWSPGLQPGGTGTLTRVHFVGNAATGDGGALNVDTDGTLIWTDGSAVGNSAGGNGGGLALDGVDMDLSGVWVCGNTAAGQGGGALLAQTTGPGWRYSTFLENTGSDGGALFITQAPAIALRNLSVVGNDPSGGLGGGVLFDESGTDLFSTLVAHHGQGNGLHKFGPLYGPARDWNGFFDNQSNHLGGGLNHGGSDVIDLDPMLTDLTLDGDCYNDDLTPLPGSPLIDAGDPGVQDLDGSVSDIGSGQQAPPDPGPATGPGTGTGTGAATGSSTGTGSGTGAGTGSGTGAGTGSGTGAGTGSSTGTVGEGAPPYGTLVGFGVCSCNSGPSGGITWLLLAPLVGWRRRRG